MLKSYPPTGMKLFYNAINVVITMAAKIHVDEFWGDKVRVPFVEGYNEGMRRTEAWSQNLGLIAGTWAVTLLVEVFRLFAG